MCFNSAYKLDNGLVYLKELDTRITLLSFGIILSVGIFNAFGVYITKVVNAPGRCIIMSSRSILVWVIGLILTASQIQ